MSKVVLATCQFRIEKQVKKNLISIKRQMKKAKSNGAHPVHFKVQDKPAIKPEQFQICDNLRQMSFADYF